MLETLGSRPPAVIIRIPQSRQCLLRSNISGSARLNGAELTQSRNKRTLGRYAEPIAFNFENRHRPSNAPAEHTARGNLRGWTTGATGELRDRSAAGHPSYARTLNESFEKYLELRPHNLEQLLDRLVEVLERPEIAFAIDRLQRESGASLP